MGDLLHPPDHRGPTIAAGAVTLSVGIAVLLVRFEPEAGVRLAILGVLALVLLWLGLQRGEAGPPPAFASVLVVTGLAAVLGALVSLGELLADEPGAGTGTWVSIVLAAVAAFCAGRRSSSVAALIAALAGGAALLFAYAWIFDSPESTTGYRWLLLLLAVVYVLTSLVLRATSQRHGEQMVNAAGIAILGIPVEEAGLLLFGTPALPGFWEGIVLVAGLGLIAYAAADRAPGPAYLGVANVVAFVLIAGPGRDELLVWPLLLLVVGGVVLAVGLRPRKPLPPEPGSSTRPDDLPLTVRVRRD